MNVPLNLQYSTTQYVKKNEVSFHIKLPQDDSLASNAHKINPTNMLMSNQSALLHERVLFWNQRKVKKKINCEM